MTTKLSPATKYRVAIRDIAISHGWTFTQVGSLDRFAKGETVIAVQHGPSNLITHAARTVGRTAFDETPRAGRMFVVQEWLTGIADPNHERFIRLNPEQVRKYESGQGIARIEPTLGEKIEVHETKPAPARTAKLAPAKASTERPKPVAKPAPRAAKPAPAAAAK